MLHNKIHIVHFGIDGCATCVCEHARIKKKIVFEQRQKWQMWICWFISPPYLKQAQMSVPYMNSIVIIMLILYSNTRVHIWYRQLDLLFVLVTKRDFQCSPWIVLMGIVFLFHFLFCQINMMVAVGTWFAHIYVCFWAWMCAAVGPQNISMNKLNAVALCVILINSYFYDHR